MTPMPAPSPAGLRVLMLSWEYPPNIVGGLGRHVAELIQAMSAELVPSRFEMHLLTPGAPPAAAYERVGAAVHVHRFPWPRPPSNYIYDSSEDLYGLTMQINDSLLTQAFALAERHAFHLLHAHDWLPTQAALELQRAWRIPLLATIHATEKGRHYGHLGNELNRMIHAMEARLCHASARIIVCSQFMRDSLRETFHVPPAICPVIPNGIAMPEPAARTTDDKRRLFRAYRDQGENLLLFVGRMTHQKGLHVLLDALPQVLARHPHTRLLVVGRRSDALEPEIRRRGLQDAVSLLGFVTDAQRNEMLATADAALMPSLYEPFGIVALEAMAAGCPVIVSRVGGLAEVVKNGVTGLTVRPDDAQSLCQAIDQVLTYPLQARQRAAQAQAVVKADFNWARIARLTLDVYASVATAVRGGNG